MSRLAWKIIDLSGRGLGNQEGPLYRCSKCEGDLPRNEFSPVPKTSRGCAYQCHDCKTKKYFRRKLVILESTAVFEMTDGSGVILDIDVAMQFLNIRISLEVDGYVTYKENRKTTKLHHFVMGKPPKGMQVDHINRDMKDNRRANLRFVTLKQNCNNRHNRYEDGKLYVQQDYRYQSYYNAYTYINHVRTNLANGKDKEQVGYTGKLKLMEIQANEQ